MTLKMIEFGLDRRTNMVFNKKTATNRLGIIAEKEANLSCNGIPIESRNYGKFLDCPNILKEGRVL